MATGRVVSDLHRRGRPLRSWVGLLAVNKPPNTHPSSIRGSLEYTISSHNTELPAAARNVQVEYFDGTDSFHEGVLVLGLGRGTLALDNIRKLNRTYRLKGFLGRSTDTFTSTGQTVSQRPIGGVTKELIDATLAKKYYRTIALPIPPVQYVDRRRILSRWHRKQILATLSERTCTSHYELVWRPARIKKIECIDFSPPFFTIEVTGQGNFNPYGLMYQIAHDVGTCGHVDRAQMVSIDRFTMDHCLPMTKLGDVREVYKVLSDSFTLWDTSCISKAKRKQQQANEAAETLKQEISSLKADDICNKATFTKIAPLLMKGPVAREDIPLAAAPIQDLIVGRRNLKDFKQVLESVVNYKSTATTQKPVHDDDDANARREVALEAAQKAEQLTPLEPVVRKHRPRSTHIEKKPENFATYKSKNSHRLALTPGRILSIADQIEPPEIDALPTGHVRHQARQQQIGDGSPGEEVVGEQVLEMDGVGEDSTSVRDRLKAVKRAKKKDGSGFTWKSKFAV